MAASMVWRALLVVRAPNPFTAKLTPSVAEIDSPVPTVSPVILGVEVAETSMTPAAVTVESWMKARTVLRSLSSPILLVARAASIATLPPAFSPTLTVIEAATTRATIVESSLAVTLTSPAVSTWLPPVSEASTSLVSVLNAWAPTPDSEMLLAWLIVSVGTAATGTERLVAVESAVTAKCPAETTVEPSTLAFSVFAISLLVIEIPTSKEKAVPPVYSKARLMAGATALILDVSAALTLTLPVPVVRAVLPPVIEASVVLPISFPAPAPAPSSVIPAPCPSVIAAPTLSEIDWASISGSEWASSVNAPPDVTVAAWIPAWIDPPRISLKEAAAPIATGTFVPLFSSTVKAIPPALASMSGVSVAVSVMSPPLAVDTSLSPRSWAWTIEVIVFPEPAPAKVPSKPLVPLAAPATSPAQVIAVMSAWDSASRATPAAAVTRESVT